jgi:hypothetical protein
MPSNRDEQKVKGPNLQNAEVISRLSHGKPWYGPRLGGADQDQSEAGSEGDRLQTQVTTTTQKSQSSTSPIRPAGRIATGGGNNSSIALKASHKPFRSDIKMVRRANITAPAGNKTDEDYEYFYYYYYDYIYPDEEATEPLPKPVPLSERGGGSGVNATSGAIKKKEVKKMVKVKKQQQDANRAPPPPPLPIPRPLVLSNR